MATKDVVLKGQTYTGIDSLEVPTDGGGTAKFVEVSDTTATANDVVSGSYFYNSSGTRTLGVAVIPSNLSDLTNDMDVSDFPNDAGYLTSYTETDPVFVASAAHGISSSDISNWDNAYDGNIDFDTTAQSGDDYNLTQILTDLGWLSDVIV